MKLFIGKNFYNLSYKPICGLLCLLSCWGSILSFIIIINNFSFVGIIQHFKILQIVFRPKKLIKANYKPSKMKVSKYTFQQSFKLHIYWWKFEKKKRTKAHIFACTHKHTLRISTYAQASTHTHTHTHTHI